MKLQLTIPDRPKLVHLLPVFDIIAVFFAFPLVVKAFAPQGGHQIVTPEYTLRVPTFENAAILEMYNSDGLQIWLNQQQINIKDAPSHLEKIQNEWLHGGSPVVLLKMDHNVNNKQRSQLLNLLIEMEFSVYEVGHLKSQ